MIMSDLVIGSCAECSAYCKSHFKKRYFAFTFSYVSTDTHFREIDRFLWESKHRCTRFRNRYIGPVVIDMSEWSDRQSNEYFDAFMYFLLDNHDSFNILFVSQTEFRPDISKTMSRYFDIDKIYLPSASLSPSGTKLIGFDIEEVGNDGVV